MAQPWNGPTRLLSTIQFILKNRDVKVKDIPLYDSVGLSDLNPSRSVPTQYLRGMIASLKKTAPELYKKNSRLIEASMKGGRLPAQTKTRDRSIARPVKNDKVESYSKIYPEDKRFILDSLVYLYGEPFKGVKSVPIDTALNLIALLPNSDLCLGFLTAEQLLGMICHKYNIKPVESLIPRIHLEHGLATSVMPDKLLSHTYIVRLNKSNNKTEEAFKFHYAGLISEGLKEKRFTRDQINEIFDQDKDLKKSRIKLILKIK